jgi:hypothetical protein
LVRRVLRVPPELQEELITLSERRGLMLGTVAVASCTAILGVDKDDNLVDAGVSSL